MANNNATTRASWYVHAVEKIKRIKDIIIHRTVAYTSFVYFRILRRGYIVGDEVIDANRDKGFILAANHVSYLDWIVLWCFFFYKKHLSLIFLGKTKLFSHKIWGSLMRVANVIEVSNEGDSFIRRSDYGRMLKTPYLAIFPEGTRSFDGKLGPFHTGVINMALRTKRPIIPVALVGFYEAWPRGRALPKLFSRRMVIVFGEPIHVENQSRKDIDISALENELRQRIEYMLTTE
jgi:1-acyl-sn-glycerol-3-phosphate acyltransferase